METVFWVKFVVVIVVRLKNRSVCGWFDRLLEILENSQFDITPGGRLPQGASFTVLASNQLEEFEIVANLTWSYHRRG